MSDRATLIVFLGPPGESPVEAMVSEARRAATLDLLDQVAGSSCFEGVILVTGDRRAGEEAPPSVTVDYDKGPFHFGRRLAEVIRRYQVEVPLYMGGGSAPLLPLPELTAMAARAAERPGALIANNLVSSDFLAFNPGSAIEEIELPELDNPLAHLLKSQAGLETEALEKTAATQFDIDTPTCLLILSVVADPGTRLGRYLEGLGLDVGPLMRAAEFFTDITAEVILAGRVPSYVWTHLETGTACRVRVFSEERGMRAIGRLERGEVRSLLGFYLEQVGVRGLFRALAEMGDAAFVDSRVLWAHVGLELPAADRFYSDLGAVEKIQDPVAREFTQAAAEAPIPVLLGGHALVAGGLHALVDAAWQENDRRVARLAEEVIEAQRELRAHWPRSG